MKQLLTVILLGFFSLELFAAEVLQCSVDPIVPLSYRRIGIDQTVSEIKKIKSQTSIHRFILTGPEFNSVMFGPFSDDLYSKMADDISSIREKLNDEDVEISWWCSPSIRYTSKFSPIVDSEGRQSEDNKKCPFYEDFASDFASKIKAVAKSRPKIINIEDDFTLSWGRGLGRSGPCYCKKHLKAFATLYGKALSAKEIDDAFKNRTPENLKIRQAFAESIRQSLVFIAAKVRAAVDEVDPTIRIMLCQSSGIIKDGDALVPVLRAFAGNTRAAVRPSGAIYGAETTPADIPRALSYTLWTLEHLPPDIETFYEADVYPHNRFFSSASQLMSLMAGAQMMGCDNHLLYALQYLDDPFEDPGYAKAFTALKPKLDFVRSFVKGSSARLEGVRIVWTASDSYLTRGYGKGHGVQLPTGSYLMSKFGIPYTSRSDSNSVALMIGDVAETMSDDEIKRLLSGGLILDAGAAHLLARRGFSQEIGCKVEPIKSRPRIVDEEILPAAGCKKPGRHTNAFYIFFAGTEGTVSEFVRLSPSEKTQVWSRFYGIDGKPYMPSVTFAENSLGGKVAVFSTSLAGNRSSGLLNLRKQELIVNLIEKLSPDSLPISVRNAPGIWTLASVSQNGKEMLVMINNLSGDVRDEVTLAFQGKWQNAKISRVMADGTLSSLGLSAKEWKTPFVLGQMEPEFILVSSSH